MKKIQANSIVQISLQLCIKLCCCSTGSKGYALDKIVTSYTYSETKIASFSTNGF